MTPGPTFVPEKILRALSKPLVHHREEEFTVLLSNCYEGLKKVFETKNDVFILTGSGTSAMDAAVSNVVNKGDDVLCVVSGKFSSRLKEIVENYGGKPEVIDVKPGGVVNPERVREKLDKKEFKAVTMVHNNTSTGSVNPIKEVGEIVKEHEALFIVDTVSSLGGDSVEVDKSHIDLCFAGSQKCLALPPGLSFITVSEKAWEVIKKKKSKPYYLNLQNYKQKHPQTPFTIAINMIYALNESLNLVFEEGLSNRIKRHQICQEMVREAVKALNLNLFVEDKVASKTVTSVEIPPLTIPQEIEKLNISLKKKRDKALRETLKRYGVLVAKGQSWNVTKDKRVDLFGEIFRIGHMGFIYPRHVLKTISALELTLKELKHEFKEGEGITKAQEILEKNMKHINEI